MPSMETAVYFYNLLKNDTPLTTALGSTDQIVDSYPDSFSVLPIVAYSEINNRSIAFADNKPYADEVTFQIDIFSTTPTYTIANLITTLMETSLFTKDFSSDIPNTDAKVYHKVMRFRRSLTADDLDSV